VVGEIADADVAGFPPVLASKDIQAQSSASFLGRWIGELSRLLAG
jgi:hypothetical protein